jgi:hypothetical protein
MSQHATDAPAAGQFTYLTTEELAAKIKYDPSYIRRRLKDTVLLEGVHYIRPFGGRKILYLWEAIEREMSRRSQSFAPVIPMANGRRMHG